MDSQKKKLQSQKSGIMFELEQIGQKGKKMIEVQLVKMQEHDKLIDLKSRLEKQLKKINEQNNSQSTYTPIEVDFLVDQNKKILEYPHNDLDSIVRLTQNKRIYYQLIEENVNDENDEQKNTIAKLQDTYFMSEKMGGRFQQPCSPNKDPSIQQGSQEFIPQQMSEESLSSPSVHQSSRSISTIIILKCPTEKCEKLYDSKELKEILYGAILHKQIACCDNCKKSFPSSMYQVLGSVAKYYNDLKIALQLSELQNEIQKTKAKCYLFCQTCNFFCLKQAQYEKSLSKMFCPNCLTFGLQQHQ